MSHPRSLVDTVCMVLALLALLATLVGTPAMLIAYGWRAAAYTALGSLACFYTALIVATAYEQHRS